MFVRCAARLCVHALKWVHPRRGRAVSGYVLQGSKPYRGVFSSALMVLQEGNEGKFIIAVWASHEKR